MHEINIEVRWTDKNYCCAWSMEGFGAVICTNKTLSGLKEEFEESLRWQIESMVEDGEGVPEWLVKGEYVVKYELHTSALLREAEKFTTMSAISKVTGINVKQLSHYATSTKNPRPEQRKRIIEGLHTIGQNILSFC